MGEKTKWDRFYDAMGRFWGGLCNFCRRVTDRKFMATTLVIVGAFSAGLDPATAAAVSATVGSVFVVLKGVVEIAERWKDVKIEEIKAKNGGSQ